MKFIAVKDVMTRNPVMVKPEQTTKNAARQMKELGCGVLPVGTPVKVFGMLTDRDIATRLVAEGGDALLTPVREIMTKDVYMCQEGDSLAHAAELMRRHDVSRLIVTDGRQATGIVTLAALLRASGKESDSDKVLHELLYSKSGQEKNKPACCA